MLTLGSLFDGIAGFPYAAQQCGVETKWTSEIDPYCRKLLKQNFPGIPDRHRYGDIKGMIHEKRIPWTTIISAGMPCQPFSTAGQRRGSKDDRFLWAETLAIIKEVRPTWAIIENVVGLSTISVEEGPFYLDFSSVAKNDGENYFRGICSRKERLLLCGILDDFTKAGYDVQAFAVPAAAFDADHIRQRIWIIAYTDSRRFHQRCSKAGWETWYKINRSVREIQKRMAANADRWRESFRWKNRRMGRQKQSFPDKPIFTHSTSERCEKLGRETEPKVCFKQSDGVFTHTDSQGLLRQGGYRRGSENAGAEPSGYGWGRYTSEPTLCGRDARVPHRVDRIKGSGNSLQVEVARFIFGLIDFVEKNKNKS